MKRNIKHFCGFMYLNFFGTVHCGVSNWPPKVDEAAEGISSNVCLVMLVEERVSL